MSFDLHCHIDLYPDPKKVLDKCESLGISVLAVTTTPRAWIGNQRLIASRKNISASIGLHPEVAGARISETDLLCSIISDTPYVGEIGLDGSAAHRSSLANQTAVFTSAIEACAKYGGRIISIHSRGAANRVLDVLEDIPGHGVPILHWFTGSVGELKRAVQMGCWFSVGPAMLRSKNGRDLVSRMPMSRILTETDGPFTREGNDPLYPWQANLGLPGIAHAQGISMEEAVVAVRLNFESLFPRGL